MQFHIFIIELQVLYKILKKINNTGTNLYTSDRQVQEITNDLYIPITEHLSV
jgi:hypothetical protein